MQDTQRRLCSCHQDQFTSPLVGSPTRCRRSRTQSPPRTWDGALGGGRGSRTFAPTVGHRADTSVPSKSTEETCSRTLSSRPSSFSTSVSNSLSENSEEEEGVWKPGMGKTFGGGCSDAPHAPPSDLEPKWKRRCVSTLPHVTVAVSCSPLRVYTHGGFLESAKNKTSTFLHFHGLIRLARVSFVSIFLQFLCTV